MEKHIAYCFVSSNFRVIWDVSLDIFPPDDWVILLQPEESHNIFSPCFKGIEPFLVEDVWQMTLDSGDSISGNMVAEDTE